MSIGLFCTYRCLRTQGPITDGRPPTGELCTAHVEASQLWPLLFSCSSTFPKATKMFVKQTFQLFPEAYSTLPGI